MNSLQTAKMAWKLLDKRDHRNALIVLFLIVIAALSSAVMVGSFMPFLLVLSDPQIIKESNSLNFLYNHFEFRSDFDFLVAMGIVTVTVILIAGLIQIIRAYAVARFAMMRMHSISKRLFSCYLNQPYDFFLSENSGALNTKILPETQAVVNQFFRPAADVIAGVLTILSIVVVLVVANPLVAFVSFGVFAAFYGAVFLSTRSVLQRLGRHRLGANTRRFKIATESLAGAKFVKLGVHEENFVSRFEEPSREFARTQAKVMVLGEVPTFAMQMFAFGGGVVFLVVLLGSYGLESGTINEVLPIAGLFAIAAMRIMPELGKVYRSLTKLQVSGVAVEAIYRDLELESRMEPRATKRSKRVQKELLLEDVSFRYPSSNGRGGIDGISISIKPGEKIGVVGGSGAGKTTFADILMGLLYPSEGRMFADDQEILAENIRTWRRSIGYVPQDIFLTDGSVEENIAFGLDPEEIDREQVTRAGKIAQIHQFITQELPEGYDTKVGERGVRLSGGQRQRIGIARALFYDPGLIVFDEATSALDTLTERSVMQAIENLPDDKTVVLIAHRLTTVKNCDRILLLKDGQLESQGSWDELFKNNETFRDLATGSQA